MSLKSLFPVALGTREIGREHDPNVKLDSTMANCGTVDKNLQRVDQRISLCWPTSSGTRRYHIEKNGKVVGYAAGQYKDMPGGVEVAQAVQSKESDSQRVGQSPATSHIIPCQPMAWSSGRAAKTTNQPWNR